MTLILSFQRELKIGINCVWWDKQGQNEQGNRACYELAEVAIKLKTNEARKPAVIIHIFETLNIPDNCSNY